MRRANGKRPAGPVVSVRWEMAEIRLAVGAARMLLDELSADNQDDAALVRGAARAAQAVLALVESRLQLLDQGIAGLVDLRLLVARHNKLDEIPDDDQPDLYIETDRRGER